MAATRLTSSPSFGWVLVVALHLCTAISGSDLPHYVAGDETEPFVSLPCNISSGPPGPHQVTWYRQRHGRDSVVLQMNATGSMMSSPEFQNRVGLGKRWSMLLAAPSLFDSGSYVCEIDGTPPAKAHVKLKIHARPHSSQEVSQAISTAPSLTDAVVVILLVWIAPVAWLIVFTFQRNGLWIKWFRSLRLPEKARIGCAFCGLLLSFASLLLLSLYLAKGKPALHALYVAGLGLGSVGIVCLVVPLILIFTCNRLQRTRRTKSQLEGLDEQDGDNLLVKDVTEGNPMNEASGTPVEETGGEDKRGAVPKYSPLPKDRPFAQSKAATLPRHELLPKSKKGTLPKYGSLPKSKTGTLPKGGPFQTSALPKGAIWLRDIQGENCDDRGSQADSDDESTESDSGLIQLDWGETIIEKPSLARINDMIFAQDGNFYLCEDHRIYSYTPASNRFDKLLENVEVHLSALACDEKGTLFILCRSEAEGWHVASIDVKDNDKKHRIRFNLPGFPARYNWLTFGHGRFYVSEKKAHHVEIFSKVGKREGSFGEKTLGSPTCIVQNDELRIFVADSKNGDVYVFDENGKFLSSLGESAPADVKERLLGSHRATVTKEGRIFVATAISNVIFVFDSDFAPLAWLASGNESSGPISSIIYANQSLYVAQDDSIHVYTETEKSENGNVNENTE